MGSIPGQGTKIPHSAAKKTERKDGRKEGIKEGRKKEREKERKGERKKRQATSPLRASLFSMIKLKGWIRMISSVLLGLTLHGSRFPGNNRRQRALRSKDSYESIRH